MSPAPVEKIPPEAAWAEYKVAKMYSSGDYSLLSLIEPPAEFIHDQLGIPCGNETGMDGLPASPCDCESPSLAKILEALCQKRGISL